jgi:large subunit ribosomal protein L30
MAVKQLRLTQFKSPNGSNERQKGTLRTLGLGKIGATSERPDEPTVRGAIHKVSHLVKVED